MRKEKTNNRILWGSILFMLALFIIVLFVNKVPQYIQMGGKGQVALEHLDVVGEYLLSIKTAVTQYQIDGNVNRAKSELQRLGEKTEARINEYNRVADYSVTSSNSVKVFTTAYYRWFNAEYDYLEQYSEIHNTQIENMRDKDHHLILALQQGNALFLSALVRLVDAEPMFHNDIIKGQKAYRFLQWVSGLLIAYIFIALFLFQRYSTRVHAAREKNLEMTLKSIGEAVITTDIHGCITGMNPEAERLTGWFYKNAKARPLSEVFKVVNAHSGTPVDDLMERVQREQAIVVLAEDSMLIAANGKRYQIYESGAPICNETNEIIGVVLVFRDISREFELKNTLQENALRLRRVNVILRETQRMAKLGYWEFDLVNNAMQWSDETFRILDLDPAVCKPCYESFLDVVHPEDRGRVDTAWNESLKYKTPYNIIHRIVTNEGIKIVHEQCDTSYDDNGKAVRSLGLVQDITQRVSDPDEVWLAETLFRPHAGIIVTDRDGIIVSVNTAFEEMTGYSAAKLIGKNPRILQSGRQSKAFYKKLWCEVVTEGSWQGELCNKRKDGLLYAEWLTIAAVKNHSGELTHYVGTFQDMGRCVQ